MKDLGVPDDIARHMDGKEKNDCPFCEEKTMPLLRHMRKSHTAKGRPEYKTVTAYAEVISQKRQKKQK